MKENVRIAKELIGMARGLVLAMARKMDLSDYEKRKLQDGDIRVFADVFMRNWKSEAKRIGLTKENCLALVDFDDSEKVYAICHKNGDRDFFNVEMKYLGRKQH